MYIVIIKENTDEEQFRNELFFKFETLEETMKFTNEILTISNNRIEIIPPEGS